MPGNGVKTNKTSEKRSPIRDDNFGLGAGLKSLERDDDIDNKLNRIGTTRTSQVRYKSPVNNQPVSKSADKRKEAVSIPTGKKIGAKTRMNNNADSSRNRDNSTIGNVNKQNLNASDIKKKMQEKANERSGVSNKQLENEMQSKEILNPPKNRLENHQGNVKSRVTTKIQPKVQPKVQQKVEPTVHLKMQSKALPITESVANLNPKAVIPMHTKSQPIEDTRSTTKVIEKEVPLQETIKKRMQQNAHLHNSHERPVEIPEPTRKTKGNTDNNTTGSARFKAQPKNKPKTEEQPYAPKFSKPQKTRYNRDGDEESNHSNNTLSKQKIFIIIGIILSIALLGGGYITLTKNKAGNNMADRTTTSDKDSQAMQISSTTKFVGIAEGSLVATDYDRASQAVEALKDCAEKTALQERLKAVKKDMDNTSSTSKEESKRQADIAKEVESKEPTKPADATPVPTDNASNASTPAPTESKATPAPAPKASTPAPKATVPATPAKKPVEQQKGTVITVDQDGNVVISN